MSFYKVLKCRNPGKMNNIFKLCIIIAVSLFSLFGYFYYKNTINHSEEYIYIDTATTEVVEYIEKINKMEEQVFKFVDDDLQH